MLGVLCFFLLLLRLAFFFGVFLSDLLLVVSFGEISFSFFRDFSIQLRTPFSSLAFYLVFFTTSRALSVLLLVIDLVCFYLESDLEIAE